MVVAKKNSWELNPAIMLSNNCNKSCKPCLRGEDRESFSLTREEMLGYLSDLETLTGEHHNIRISFFTGGEPTIWHSEGWDLTDLLMEAGKRPYMGPMTVPTNGFVFKSNPQLAREFALKLTHTVKKPVIIGLSVSDYQENFNINRSDELDALMLARDEAADKSNGSDANPLSLVVLITLSKDFDIHKEMLKVPKYSNLLYRITPLSTLGSGKTMSERAPMMSVAGKDKSDLGVYADHLKTKFPQNLQFDSLSNSYVFNQLSLGNNCGRSPFIARRWRYCLPLMDTGFGDLGEIGSIKPDTIVKFVDENPMLGEIRNHGVIEAFQKNAGLLKELSRKKLDNIFGPSTSHPVAYRGCHVCLSLYEAGIFSEMNHALQKTAVAH